MIFDRARAEFPIGTKVLYYPLLDEKEVFTEHTVRSEPWALGHGEIVVQISGKAGGVSLDHLRVA